MEEKLKVEEISDHKNLISSPLQRAPGRNLGSPRAWTHRKRDSWHQGEAAQGQAGQDAWSWALPTPQVFLRQVRNNKLSPGPAGGSWSYRIFTSLNPKGTKRNFSKGWITANVELNAMNNESVKTQLKPAVVKQM